MNTTAEPLVSVLIPICNVEQYLGQCLDSIAAQTLEDIEIICINDGSTDSSLEIINSYAARDPRFVVIDKPNSGYGDSMNKGLEKACGKYISILESDDFVEPDALEYMYRRCEDESLEVLKCNFYLYWTNPGPERLNHHNLFFSAAPAEVCAMGAHRVIDVPDLFWSKNSIWSALYRRDFLEKNNIKFLPTPGASFQDTSFTFKVYCCVERLACSSRAFLHYRQDNEKSSVNNPGKVFCVCDEHEEMARFLNEERPDLKAEIDPIRAKIKFYNYRWNLYRLAPELRLQFLERFASEMREELAAGNVRSAEGDFAWLGFSDGELDEVHSIVEDTKFYGAKCTVGENGKLETARAYFNAGGLPFIARVLGDKLKR